LQARYFVLKSVITLDTRSAQSYGRKLVTA
jgi:hypothetical protein